MTWDVVAGLAFTVLVFGVLFGHALATGVRLVRE
jgi:hypothetical protein